MSPDSWCRLEQRSLPGTHFRAGWTVQLDVVPGYSAGFGFLPADGMRFAIRDHNQSAASGST